MPENENENNETECDIENVRVVVRIRPFNKKEEEQNCQTVTSVDQEENVITLNKPAASKTQSKSFKFDHIFKEDCTQLSLYKTVASPIAKQIFRGYNGTIFAYGQTGSGKTYTMTGNQEENELKGVIPNTFSHIFSQISQASGEKVFVVTATYLEIYNEEVRDLLSPNPNKKLQLRERTDIGVYVKGLTGFTVDSIESINKLMKLGNMNRKTRATTMNNVSSRSHAIFTVIIEAKDRKDNTTTIAKLNLVDLAGSERLKRTHATGDGLKEASNINQSLFVLSNVISALVEGKNNHVPYRNSKLTRLLQDSLGGNSTTAMIATISPSAPDYDETLCTLRYASRAKLIKNYVRLNLQTNNSLIEHLEKQLLEMQKRLESLVLTEEQVVTQKVKKKRLKSDESVKRKEKDEEFSNIGSVKNKLEEKIAMLQNKILVGGQNLYDKVQEQQFLLESSFEEIKNLDQSHQEMEEALGEKELERFDLEEQNSSLQEQDKLLDEKITQLEALLQKTATRLEEEHQQQQQELDLFLENTSSLTNQLIVTNMAINTAIPPHQMKKIDSHTSWNEDMCDYQVNGIAHVGNHLKKRIERRFRKHIPKSALLGMLLNERKTMASVKKPNLSTHTITNTYHCYSSQNIEEEEEEEEEESSDEISS